MKNFIKRILVNMIFTAEERNAIINALDYSELRYRRRGNTERALMIGNVKSRIQGFFKKSEKSVNNNEKNNKFSEQSNFLSKEDALKLITKTAAMTAIFVIEEIHQEIMEAMDNKDSEPEDNGEEVLVHFQRYDDEKCSECEKKEKCFLYNHIHKMENNEKLEDEKHEEKEKPEPSTSDEN